MPQEATDLLQVEYLFHVIDFEDKLILDAGTGPGQTIEGLVDRAIETGGSNRIISVNHNQDALDNVQKQLGDRAENVRFLKADLADMQDEHRSDSTTPMIVGLRWEEHYGLDS
jgi:ubiquinone/menaquinone biosynthesis C-methylase UbiE